MKSNYELLKNKEILSILNGDTVIEEVDNIKIKMPYLSGPNLCELSQKFRYYQEYIWGNSKKPTLSRWMYLNNLLTYLIGNNKTSEFLKYMFSKKRFSDELKELNNVDEIEEKYNYIVKKVIDKINSILYFKEMELCNINNQYIIKKHNEQIIIEVPNINSIDIEYIKNISTRAIKDIEENNYDSAITKARTLLEEVFCYVIEKKDKIPSDSGNIHTLYKQVKELYNMHPNNDMDVRIKKLLSGLENLVQSLAEMRNNGSDSHGLGNKRIEVKSYHARLCVNSASSMAEFILSVANNN